MSRGPKWWLRSPRTRLLVFSCIDLWWLFNADGELECTCDEDDTCPPCRLRDALEAAGCWDPVNASPKASVLKRHHEKLERQQYRAGLGNSGRGA